MLDDVGYGDLSRYGSTKINTPNIDQVGAAGVTFSQLYTPGPGSADGLSDFECTLPEILRDRGYRTGLFGKWHLGDPALRPELNPLEHGFDEFFGIPVFDLDRPFRWTTAARSSSRSMIKRRPISLGAAPIGRSTSSGSTGTIPSSCHLGRLLDELRACGLDRDTLVMITSDNGPDLHGTGGLRDGKGSTFEGGIRMPFVARWPGRIRPGTFYRDPACLTVVLPTVAAIAGGDLPTDRPIDGVDLSRSWRGRGRQRVIYHYHDWTLNAVRRGRWKLHLPRSGERSAARRR